MAVEPQHVRRIGMCRARVDVLVADLRPLGDDMDQRHRVAATKAVVVGEPLHDRRGFGGLVEPLLAREVDELTRGQAGLGLDVVEVCLERHIYCSSQSVAGMSSTPGSSCHSWMMRSDAWMQSTRS